MEWCVFHKFFVHNGVKQGGILSPFLFCLFVNDLIAELEQNKEGCLLVTCFTGALHTQMTFCYLPLHYMLFVECLVYALRLQMLYNIRLLRHKIALLTFQ